MDGIQSFEENLRERFSNLPLTTSQTHCAKLMRCAVAEAVIGQALADHIFVDMYIPGIQWAVSTFLDRLAGDSERQNIVRCQMLVGYDADDEGKQSAVNDAVNDVAIALGP